MTEYAHVDEQGVITPGGVPDSIILPDGSVVTGLDGADAETLEMYGYYPVSPVYEPLDAHEHHGLPIYTFDGEVVTATHPAEPDSQEQQNQSAIQTNLTQDLEAMQLILDSTNATINQNPAVHIKNIARMNKRLGRVALGDYSEAD